MSLCWPYLQSELNQDFSFHQKYFSKVELRKKRSQGLYCFMLNKGDVLKLILIYPLPETEMAGNFKSVYLTWQSIIYKTSLCQK